MSQKQATQGKGERQQPNADAVLSSQMELKDIVRRSDLVDRAFNLGIDYGDLMSTIELIEAIRRAEDALNRALQ